MHALSGITLLLILSKNKIAKDTIIKLRNSFLKLKEWKNECHLISLNKHC